MVALLAELVAARETGSSVLATKVIKAIYDFGCDHIIEIGCEDY
jgi:hypothetical protein